MSKFKNGDIVRYSNGSTALMRIDHDETKAFISPTLGMRYYGIQYYGSACGAYEVDMNLATETELSKWNKDHDNNGKFTGKFSE
jgi:hypothetical protein